MLLAVANLLLLLANLIYSLDSEVLLIPARLADVLDAHLVLHFRHVNYGAHQALVLLHFFHELMGANFDEDSCGGQALDTRRVGPSFYNVFPA